MTTLIKIAPSITLSPLTLLYLYSLHSSLLYTVLCNTLIYLFISPSHNLKVPWKRGIAFLPLLPQHLEEWQHGKLSGNIHWVKKEGKGERKDNIKVDSEVSDLYNWTDGDGGATYWVGSIFRGPGLGEVRRFIIFRLKLR